METRDGGMRLEIIDAARGTGIALMIAYHAAFVLDHVGAAGLDLDGAPGWRAFRAVILGIFLLTVGASLHLATARGVDPRWLTKRTVVLGACAAAITFVSSRVFPGRTVVFGVLHFIAVSSVLALPLRRLGRANFAIGGAVLAAGALVSHPAFDAPGLHWLGLMTHRPATVDYVPLLPWFGLVLIGMPLGEALAGSSVRSWRARLAGSRLLVAAGRRSLLIYLVHGPILFALAYAVKGRS